jgi:hypothetical protein
MNIKQKLISILKEYDGQINITDDDIRHNGILITNIVLSGDGNAISYWNGNPEDDKHAEEILNVPADLAMYIAILVISEYGDLQIQQIGYYNNIEDLQMLAGKSADDIVSNMLAENGHFYKTDDEVDAVSLLDLNPSFTSNGDYAVVFDIPTDMSMLEEYIKNDTDFFIDVYKII